MSSGFVSITDHNGVVFTGVARFPTSDAQRAAEPLSLPAAAPPKTSLIETEAQNGPGMPIEMDAEQHIVPRLAARLRTALNLQALGVIVEDQLGTFPETAGGLSDPATPLLSFLQGNIKRKLTSGKLTGRVTDLVIDLVMGPVLTDLVQTWTQRLGDILHNRLAPTLVEYAREEACDLLEAGLVRALGATLSISLSKTISKLTAKPLTDAIVDTLQDTLTRSLTHGVAHSLFHSLRARPSHASAACYECISWRKHGNPACAECGPRAWAQFVDQYRSVYYLDYDAAYFGDYYAAYFKTDG